MNDMRNIILSSGTEDSLCNSDVDLTGVLFPDRDGTCYSRENISGDCVECCKCLDMIQSGVKHIRTAVMKSGVFSIKKTCSDCFYGVKKQTQ